MKVLITGVEGFIGRHLRRALQHNVRDIELVGVDRVDSECTLQQYQFTRMDLADDACGGMEQIISGVDSVVHLAARTYVPESFREPIGFLYDNVVATARLLELIRHNPIKHLIHVSTCEVYGEIHGDPATEDHGLQPLSPYASTKLSGEMLAASYARTYEINTTVLRLFNVFGPEQQQNRLIPAIVHAKRSGHALHVVGRGAQSRDWTYIDDVIDAITRVLCAGFENGLRVLNIGSGKSRTVLSVINDIDRIYGGTPVAIVYEEGHPGSLQRTLADPSRAFAELGWSASTPFDAGLEMVVRYERSCIS